ncbi:MAG TPA: tyrosine-type recombinase/integrase [Candidatus Acidoferrales bacterium]|jgi:site-specific recombinase XerD|nr:tyrosine-type recombinase/integrase [Candidatus Acidoferrales bacterium]
MKWSFWIELYIRTHCVARGLRPLTLVAYEDSLQQFREWVSSTLADRAPDQITTRDVLAYLQYLREQRHNGDSAVNRAVVVLRSFYRAMVAMGYLDHTANPLVGFPSIKAVPRKLPVTLSDEQVQRLLAEPEADTVIGVRDRAILALLYGTGIRASECASLRSAQVDLAQLTITVQGKGGHERAIAISPGLAVVLRSYVQVRGPALPTAPFFRSRFGRPLSRGSVYERVRKWGQRSRVGFPLSPHRLRHTCATHLVRAKVGLETIREMLGHRLITSTQIYLHVTADDLRAAAARHPIAKLLNTVKHLLCDGPLPFQKAHAMYGSG